MTRDDDLLRLRDELTRRFDLVLRPSADEILAFRDEVARLLPMVGERGAAERAAAEALFLCRRKPAAEPLPVLRSAA